MSKYTTEVRFICEQKAGRDESAGFNDVDGILSASWDKIFTTKADIFDEAYRPIICKKILKHYYTREIGAETTGLWLLWMNTKLEEILPYYNMLWESALLEFDPFKDVDYKKTHEQENNGTKNVEGSSDTDTSRTVDENGTTNGTRDVTGTEDATGTKNVESSGNTRDNKTINNDVRTTETKTGSTDLTGTDTDVTAGRIDDNGTYTDRGTVTNSRDIVTAGTASSTASKGDRYSDTPQGTIANTDVTGNAYLTNVRLIDDTSSDTTSGRTDDDNTETRNLNGTNDNTRLESTTVTKTLNESTDVTESGSITTDNDTLESDVVITSNESEETDVNNKRSTTAESTHGDSMSNTVENGATNTVTTSDETAHSTETYIDHVFGKMSTTPYAELLQKFRDTFMNIDMLLIEEFDELFLRLW